MTEHWRRTFHAADGRLIEVSYFPHAIEAHLSALEGLSLLGSHDSRASHRGAPRARRRGVSRRQGPQAVLNWMRPISFVNARVVLPDGGASSIRFAARVLDIDAPPAANDLVVDLNGAFVMPGLVNAHDHLELNHYGRLKRRDRYENASAWIDDLRPALQGDRSIRENTAHPLAARLFIGGLKNLLAGVTTVAHHNPHYREIGRRFPVRVTQALRLGALVRPRTSAGGRAWRARRRRARARERHAAKRPVPDPRGRRR